MDIVLPTWLTKEFIRDALQDGNESPDSDTIVVKNMTVDKPIAKGDNYVCEIFRADVEYRQSSDEDLRKTSLIIKSPIVGGMYEILLKLGVIQKEVRVYNEYIPKMNRILGEGKSLLPKSYHSSQEYVLVLEDLKFQGYVMADRRTQLDYTHTVTALKTLALYHAVSVRLHEDEPDLVETVGKESFFSENGIEGNQEYAKLSFVMAAEEFKNFPDAAQYTEKLLSYSEKAWDLLVDLMKHKEGAFNVLNHGDFWVNNMLFKYDESNRPVDLKLLDLQISRYTMPTIDLMYFLYGSVQEDVRTNRLNEILNVYLEELNKHLERFGCSQRLTESELNTMMAESEFFGLVVTLSLYPIVIADPKDGLMDMKEVTEEHFKDVKSNPMTVYYKNKHFIDTCCKRLAEFERRGWF